MLAPEPPVPPHLCVHVVTAWGAGPWKGVLQRRLSLERTGRPVKASHLSGKLLDQTGLNQDAQWLPAEGHQLEQASLGAPGGLVCTQPLN